MAEEQSKKPVGVSFSFSSSKKGDSNKLGVSKLRDESLRESREEPDFIRDVQDKKINGSIKKEKKKELVIPLITKNRWRLPAGSGGAKDANDTTATDSSNAHNLEELAAREIMEETQKATEGWESRGNGVPSNIEIPLFMQNRVPSGFETDDKIDVSLRADQSTLDDYETIPVEAYGMAMLRGMGWKASEGIGLSRKGVAVPVAVTVRPKGLGLGADRSVFEKATKAVAQAKEMDETLKVAIGAYVQLLSGKHQGLYGQVESIDANSGRVLVRMAVGGNEVDISELFLKPVNAKEYRDSSRVLNKEKYDKYKSKQEKERQEEEERKKSHRKKRKHSRSRSQSRSRSRERSEKKESKSKKHSKERKEAKKELSSSSWLYPLLRVRCIDSHFKDGQYFKQKMVVIDVISKTHCICRAENGKLVDNISVSKLETVVPRTDPGYIMVVKGRHKGQVCELIERDKERCMATVQVLPDRDEVFQIDYDSICEYTGDIRNM